MRSDKEFGDAITTLYGLCFYNSAKVERGLGEWYKLTYSGYVRNTGRKFLDIDLSNPHKTEEGLEDKFKPFIYDADPELQSYIVVRELTPNQIKAYEKNDGKMMRDWLFWLKAELYLIKNPSEILKQKADSVKETENGIEFCLD